MIRSLKNVLEITFCTVILITSAHVAAFEIEYFKAEVPVKEQSDASRATAAEFGLMDVLVRISGAEQVRLVDDVITRSAKAINYVEQYQYLPLTDEALIEEGYNSILKLSYSPRAVRKFLAHAEQKFWTVSRPPVLVWLVEDSLEFGKQLVSYDAELPIFKGLEQSAAYRGVPISHPLLDFEDQVALGATRVWNLDEAAILKASERYSADVVLVGKFTTTSSGETWSSWQYFHKGQSRVFDLRSIDVQATGRDAIGPLADFLASVYAVDLDGAGSDYYVLKVRDVFSFADYRGVVRLFEKFDTVGKVELQAVEQSMLTLNIVSDASIDQLMNMLDLKDSLQKETSEHGLQLPVWQRSEIGSEANPLVYRWAR